MARFQNGLRIDASGGLVFSRWIVEFATQVLGWTLHDNNDANWSSVVASGADIATTANPNELDFSGAVYTLTSADEGRYVTMLGNAGWSAGEKETIGIYRILKVNVAAQIAYLDILRGVHENGLPASKTSVSYRLWSSTTVPAANTWAVIRTAYLHTPAEPNMDVKITCGTGVTAYPLLAMGPFGTWNSTSHAWNDTRNTTNLVFGANGSFGAYANVWAFGDETDNDHFVVLVRDTYNASQTMMAYIGAITPTAGTTTDPNPGVLIHGYGTYSAINWGYGSSGQISAGGRMMAYNGGSNNVEVAAYIMGPATVPNGAGSTNHFTGNRMWSQWSKGVYRIEPMLQCRTTGHMEARGVPKSLRLSGFYQALIPFGTSMEYLHFNGGLSIPWNGSKVHVQWNNR
jgi:hypothetical protein